jgi:hypothetical protein
MCILLIQKNNFEENYFFVIFWKNIFVSLRCLTTSRFSTFAQRIADRRCANVSKQTITLRSIK